MATTHDFDIATELSGESDVLKLVHRILADGTYTGPSVSSVDGDTLRVLVAEDSVPKATLQTILDITDPTLSLDKTSVTIAADGVATDTVTVTDSRGASASGIVVKLKWPGTTYSNANALTLDGAGQGTVTFGPCPSGECSSADGILIQFTSATENVAVVSCTVKFE